MWSPHVTPESQSWWVNITDKGREASGAEWSRFSVIVTFYQASPGLLIQSLHISLLANFQWSVYEKLKERQTPLLV